MQVYRKELNRLRSTKELVRFRFPCFGVNKRQEIVRLLYEISKRDDTPAVKILANFHTTDYHCLKKFLLEKRYPNAFTKSADLRPFLPKLELRHCECQKIKRRDFYPKRIFTDRAASSCLLAVRFKEYFPKAKFIRIKSLKDHFCKHRDHTIEDYNRRQDTVFIVNERYDFFKPCPCTKGAVGCGYRIFNMGFGCIYECSYCFLQEYTNTPGIILPANIEGFFDVFLKYKRRGMRIGTGEFSDSLALDRYTEYSLPILEFFRQHKDVLFEFKTKSGNIENLLKARHSGIVPHEHSGNVIVSWSINPQRLIDENEFLSSSLKERLSAAAKCTEAGYKVGFHFDPVIYFSGWEKEYSRLIDELFEKIKAKDMAWVSIGTFRFSPGLKHIIERRFPGNRILNEELLPGFDRKLRYPFDIRLEVYDKIIKMLKVRSRRLKIYLCMEESLMWRSLKLSMPEFAPR